MKAYASFQSRLKHVDWRVLSPAYSSMGYKRLDKRSRKQLPCV